MHTMMGILTAVIVIPAWPALSWYESRTMVTERDGERPMRRTKNDQMMRMNILKWLFMLILTRLAGSFGLLAASGTGESREDDVWSREQGIVCMTFMDGRWTRGGLTITRRIIAVCGMSQHTLLRRSFEDWGEAEERCRELVKLT